MRSRRNRQGAAGAGIIRVLVVAETRLYREGLVRLLGPLRRLLVAGSAGTLQEALDAVAMEGPIDVALIDMGMPRAGESIRDILRVSSSTRIVAMAIQDLQTDIVSAAVAGATGYLTQDASKDELTEAVYRAARGEVSCSSAIAATLVRIAAGQAVASGPLDLLELTARELQIVDLIGQGLSNKEIARRLFIAIPTVKNHVHNILEKLDVSRRLEVADRLGRTSGPSHVSGSSPRRDKVGDLLQSNRG